MDEMLQDNEYAKYKNNNLLAKSQPQASEDAVQKIRLFV